MEGALGCGTHRVRFPEAEGKKPGLAPRWMVQAIKRQALYPGGAFFESWPGQRLY